MSYMNGHNFDPWYFNSPPPWYDPWEGIYKQQFEKLYHKKGKDMRPKDLVELAKTLDELKKMGGDKKSEEKKKDPDKWDTLDYFTCIVGVGGMIIMVGTWAILYEIVKLAEALHK
jgi:hypothetical protein